MLGLYRMRHEQLLNTEKCLLLIVDIQEKFAPHIHEMDRVIERSRILIEAAGLLGVPVFVSQQYPKGLGQTVGPLREALDGRSRKFDKVTFSCCLDEALGRALQESGRNQVLLAGIETHVCVAQTALDLLAAGKRPYVAVDAVSARRRLDHDVALDRLKAAGATLTTAEAAILELTRTAQHPAFKTISNLIK